MAVKTHKPNYIYYSGNVRPNSPNLIYLFTVSNTFLLIQSFMVFKKQELNTVIDPTIGISSQQIDTSKYNFITDITTFLENKNVKFYNYITNENDKINLIAFKDLQKIYNFYEKNTGELTDLDNIYLRPYYFSVFDSLKMFTADPNIDYTFTATPNLGVIVENLNVITKQDNFVRYNFKYGSLLVINSGLANQTSFTNLNYIFSPNMKNFFSNLNVTPDLLYDENSTNFYYNNILKLKVEGPITGSVGDILEYTVTLMNNSLTDTWRNLPDLEVYPTVDAGILSHRKITLVKGVGKFKVDTTNLYSGETFDVKIGWKYLTSDSKVSVKLS